MLNLLSVLHLKNVNIHLDSLEGMIAENMVQYFHDTNAFSYCQ